MIHVRHFPARAKADAAASAEDHRMPWPVRQQRNVRIGQLVFVDLNRPAWAHDLINPGLQCGGHAEVVERRTDDQYIGGDQLIDQLVAFRQRVPHPRLTALFRRKAGGDPVMADKGGRSEEHTSELQSLMRITYAVFRLKKKTT